jgi:hypothetical protein
VTFLNPLALLALAAVALPVVLHLFNLRRPREVDFSSLAFVKELQKSAVQRVRIKEWLLLALRMLAIACLVLAFARPTLEGALSGLGAETRTAHALVVDNSLSMTLRSGPGVYLEQAKRQAEGVLQTVGAEDEILVTATAPMDDRQPSPVSRATEAQSLLAEIEPRAGSRSLTRAIADAAQRLDERTSAPRRVVYAIGDLQQATLADSLAEALPEDVALTLLPVETRPQGNVGIEAVRIRSRIAEVGQPVQMEATLVNHGSEELTDYVASVFLEGERVAQATTSLAPGQSTTVSFTATPQVRGWLTGTVEGEDDAFPDDNVRHFTLHVPNERRLLLVRGSGQPTQYVDLALSSSMVEDRIAFQTETIREEDLATRDLGQYDAVLLVGPRTLSSGEVNALQRYVKQGGGLLLFPSEQARPEDYNALFAAMGGGTFRGFTGSLGERRRIAAFDRVDLEHPLFEGIFDRASDPRSAEIERPDVFYAMNYQTSSARGQTLIELSNGFPFLHELRHGTGAMLLVATAPTPQWSDLPVRGLFIPLLYRSVYYLSSSSAAASNTLVAGRAGEIRVTGLPPAADALRITGPDGVERTPDQRTVFGATLLSFGADLHTLGLYDVQSGDRLVQRVAVNLDPRESNLQTADPSAAADALRAAANVPVQVLSVSDASSASVAESVRTQQTGTEVWNVFLLLALAFLVSEMLVASQWRPETVPA